MRSACALLLLACAATRGSSVYAEAPRATSVRGWNSYNGWGGAVNETVLLGVADFMQARVWRLVWRQASGLETQQQLRRLLRNAFARRLTCRSTATRTLCLTRFGTEPARCTLRAARIVLV